MYDGVYDPKDPAHRHLHLPMPTIHPAPPPNDEVRQLVRRAISQLENTDLKNDPYWVQAQLQQWGHRNISREVILGVINGL